jgi:hypothetical protein
VPAKHDPHDDFVILKGVKAMAPYMLAAGVFLSGAVGFGNMLYHTKAEAEQHAKDTDKRISELRASHAAKERELERQINEVDKKLLVICVAVTGDPNRCK